MCTASSECAIRALPLFPLLSHTIFLMGGRFIIKNKQYNWAAVCADDDGEGSGNEGCECEKKRERLIFHGGMTTFG